MKKIILLLSVFGIIFSGCSQHHSLESLKNKDINSYEAIDGARVYFIVDKNSKNYEKFKSSLEYELNIGNHVLVKNIGKCSNILFSWSQAVARKQISISSEFMKYSACVNDGKQSRVSTGLSSGVDFIETFYAKNTYLEFIHTASSLPGVIHNGKFWNNYFGHSAGIINGKDKAYLFTSTDYRFEGTNYRISDIEKPFDIKFYRLFKTLLERYNITYKIESN